MRIRSKVPALSLPLLAMVLAAGCSGDDACDPEATYCIPTQEVSVTVTNGGGNGSGVVEAEDISTVAINCVLPPNAGHVNPNPAYPVTCSDHFPDAGGGGTFRLFATPDAGSVFTSWTGCTTASGATCTLAFDASSSDPINVTAKFDLAPTANRTITIRNASTTVTAYLIGPEDPRPITAATEAAAEVHAGQSRETPFVLVPDPVGSQSLFVAYLVLGGTPVASIGCVVTANAWQNGTHPVVTFYDNAGGGYLVCSDGLAGL